MADSITLPPGGAAALQCETDAGIATVPLTQEVAFGSWQRGIPEEYWALGAEELTARIRAARAKQRVFPPTLPYFKRDFPGRLRH